MGEMAKDEYCTFEEWMAMDEEPYMELIDGKLYLITSQTTVHQAVSREIMGPIWDFLRGKPCKIIVGPIGVRLNESEDTVLSPDIIVVCDKSKLTDEIIIGAPDLVVEILSPSTAKKDRLIKFQKYQEAGVRELWYVDTDTNTVEVNLLENGKYVKSMYGDEDVMKVAVLDGCEIDLKEVFTEEE